MDQKNQKQNLEPQAKTWAKMSKKPPTILEVKGKKSTSPNFRRSTQRSAAQKSIICYSSGVYSGVNGLAVHAYAALGADTMLRSDQITPMLRASLWLGPECGPAPKLRGSARLREELPPWGLIPSAVVRVSEVRDIHLHMSMRWLRSSSREASLTVG